MNQQQPSGSGNGARRKPNRRRSGSKPKRPDLWRPVPQLADPAPIVPAPDPTVLTWSLGDLPLQGQGENGKHYVSKVIERAAGLATALAAAGGLLATTDGEDGLDPEVS